MTVQALKSDDGKTLVLTVSGSFVFDQHREFREGYASLIQSGSEITVNLSAVTYMDSASLGMLMLLREHAQKYSQSIKIASPQPTIRRILEVASFDKLFHIE